MLPSAWPKAFSVISRLCLIARSVNVAVMIDSMLILIAAAFLLAGFIKGVIGLGLPTVSMGLLAVTMPPGQAIAIVIVPAIVTNIWQTFGGPYLRDIMRRLWPLMVGTVIGIWLNGGHFDRALCALWHRHPRRAAGDLCHHGPEQIPASRSRAATRNGSAASSASITGVISAATGVQVIPSMPFMQAIGMEKDELVQALGVFFTVATVALAFNVTASGLMTAATALPGAVAMVASFAGMFIGQAVRSRMQPDVFRRWFLIAMIFLGLYLAVNALLKLHGEFTARAR